MSEKTPPKTGFAVLIVHHSVTVIILVLFLSLGVWGYLTFRNTDFFTTVDRSELNDQIRPPVIEAQRQRLVFAIQVFAHLHDRYPARLEELVETGLLLPSDLVYPGNSVHWNYQRGPDGFSLDWASSPDHETEDSPLGDDT